MTTQALNVFKASVGRKVLMALTGLGFALFILTHVSANLLIIFSPEAYNKYSHNLTSNPLIYIAEIGLAAIIVIHAISGIMVWLKNKSARPVGYAKAPGGNKRARFGSKSMIWSGSILLVFVILHIITFKYGTYYSINYDGVEMRDLYRLVVEVFQKPGYVVWYVICMILVGVHLSHGFASSFQSLGFSHPRYTPIIKAVGWIYSIFVALGFLILPLYVYFLKG